MKIKDENLQPDILAPSSPVNTQSIEGANQFVSSEISSVEQAAVNKQLYSTVYNTNTAVGQLQNTLQQKYRDNPQGYADDFLKQSKNLIDQSLANQPNRETSSKLGEYYSKYQLGLQTQAVSQEKTMTVSSINNTIQNQLQQITADVYNDPTKLKSSIDTLSILPVLKSSLVSPEELEAFKTSSTQVVTSAYLKGLLAKGNVEEVKNYLSSDVSTKTLGVDNKVSFVAAADQVQKQKDAEQTATQVATRNETVGLLKDMEATNQLSQVDIDDMLRSDFIRPSDHAELTNSLTTKLKSQEELTKALNLINTDKAAGIPINLQAPKVKEVLDKTWDTMISPNLQPNQVLKSLNTFIQDNQYIPTSARQNLSATLNAGTPEMQAQSAKVIVDTVNKNTNTISQLNESDILRARSLTQLTNAGVSPQEAVTLLNTNTIQKGTLAYKQRENDLAAIHFDNGEMSTGFFSITPNAPLELQSEWKNVVNKMYLSGNYPIDSAQKAAYDVIKKTWSVTNVNGSKEIMKYAPDIHYGFPNSDNGWIREQAKADAKSVAPSVDVKDLAIVPILTKSISDKPTYLLHYEDEEGIPRAVTNSKGQLLEWYPDKALGAKMLRDKVGKGSLLSPITNLF